MAWFKDRLRIFEKYRIPESYSKNPLGTLFFILRKAELAKQF
jgi:hypothetical protein